MNETTQIWLFGGAYAFIFVISTGGIGLFLTLVQRVSRLEAVMALFGEKAAKILHSPHTPELDALLEKYCDRNYTLSLAEWKNLLDMMEEIENDQKRPKEERALAAVISVMASRTLSLPPSKPHKHT